MPDAASGGPTHMSSADLAEVADWMGHLVLGAGLVVPLLLLGYGLVSLVLCRWSGREEEVETRERARSVSSSVNRSPSEMLDSRGERGYDTARL